jgi:hypothetical protein
MFLTSKGLPPPPPGAVLGKGVLFITIRTPARIHIVFITVHISQVPPYISVASLILRKISVLTPPFIGYGK